jgi:hemerythrin-like domain-containing protein
MKQPIPIKRNPAIISFSKDHHFGLLLVWKIRQGIKTGVSAERIAAYTLFFFKVDLEKHFNAEEVLLFTALDARDPLRRQAEAEHRIIRRIVEQIEENKNNISLLEQFADKLEKHIRFEERELFAHLQEQLSENELLRIAERLPNDGNIVDDNWSDIFWQHKKAV